MDNPKTLGIHSVQHVSEYDMCMTEFSETLTQNQETLDSTSENEEMMDDDEGSESTIDSKFSMTGFLSGLPDDGKKPHKIMRLALHAVLTDSGFIMFDSLSNTKIDHFQASQVRVSRSLCYTLPQLLIDSQGSEIIESVSLTVASLGNFTIVYGSLTRDGSEVWKLRLDDNKYAPAIYVVWTLLQSASSASKSASFEFWKIVKDRIALPFMIDLCDRAGLVLPPCFTRLPSGVKLRILELLPGVDVARVGCVSTELWDLSSNDVLWMMKFKERYVDNAMINGRQVVRMCKLSFALLWKQSQKEKARIGSIGRPIILDGEEDIVPSDYFPIRREQPEPFRTGRFIGGEHDLRREQYLDFPVRRDHQQFGAGRRIIPREHDIQRRQNMVVPYPGYIIRTRSMPQHGERCIYPPDCYLDDSVRRFAA